MALRWFDAGELCERHTLETMELLQPTPEDIIDEVNKRREKGAVQDDEEE